jgi:hypothetical protein
MFASSGHTSPGRLGCTWWNDEGPSRCSGPVVWMTSGYGASPGGGLTRNPEWPLQESPGWTGNGVCGLARRAPAWRTATVPGSDCARFTRLVACGSSSSMRSTRAEQEQAGRAGADAARRRRTGATARKRSAAPKPSPPTGWPLPLISPVCRTVPHSSAEFWHIQANGRC